MSNTPRTRLEELDELQMRVHAMLAKVLAMIARDEAGR